MKCRTSTSTPRRRSPRTSRSQDVAIPPRDGGYVSVSQSARSGSGVVEPATVVVVVVARVRVVVQAIVRVAPVRVIRLPVHGLVSARVVPATPIARRRAGEMQVDALRLL